VKYRLIEAETREPIGDYDASDASTLQVGSQIVIEMAGGTPQTWEVLATFEDDDEGPIALVRPAARA
jgi:hypothetical protein